MTMTDDELVKFWEDLPDPVEVPVNDDGTGDVEMVRKSKLTPRHVLRIAAGLERQAATLVAEAAKLRGPMH
jgi:hypothetical protein